MTDEYQLTKADILQLIENEIQWCKENPNLGGSQQWNNGYVAGLKNVKYIIKKAEQTVREAEDRFASLIS